jgi:hypothetical protein
MVSDHGSHVAGSVDCLSSGGYRVSIADSAAGASL